MSDGNDLVPSVNAEIIEASGANAILQKIRSDWKAKNLISRVSRILPVDPSSACQRIFNASIHDLKEKIIVAGLDIAAEAARQNKLPSISKDEDIERLDVTKTINLAYYIGLISRPQWRRILRVYDIRKDLEHEDDEYEATVEDCIYIFKTCVEVVLSKDPVHLIRLTDIKEIVEKPDKVTALNDAVIQDYKSAPPRPRQLEIYKFLISTTLNDQQPDIVRQNSFSAIKTLSQHTDSKVFIDCASDMTTKLARRTPSLIEARVFHASKIFPYLKKSLKKDYFNSMSETMSKVGYSFQNHAQHGELLRNIQEVGGLDHCHEDCLRDIIKWLLNCYLGEPSYGHYSASRKVFFSNVGAPICYEILTNSSQDILPIIEDIRSRNKRVKLICKNDYIERRYQSLIDDLQLNLDS